MLSDDDLRALVPTELIRAHRGRALSPDRPFIRGTAQNPDVYFQARETVNPFYARVPSSVQEAMDALAERTGRRYHLVEYHGDADAERVIVAMGSAAETAAETAAHLAAKGEKVGVVQIRLYRPFPTAEVLAAFPASVRRVAVLDRTKEPGALGEPLFLDVLGALAEAQAGDTRKAMPLVIGGRYGLSSKELTPAMVAGIFAELAADHPRPRFTIGINDDVSGTSLPYDRSLDIESPRTLRALFFGLGSDGTVSANKNTIKILGEDPERNAQGFFVYNSKKSGSQTVSHLRFGPDPIRAPYLIDKAGFIGCHHTPLIERAEVMERAASGATLLLNTATPAGEVWDSLPREVQEQLLAKRITLYAIDANRVARDAGLASRVNTVLQTCFFAISGVMPQEEAIAAIKKAIAKSYSAARARHRRPQPRRRGCRRGRAPQGRAPRPGDRHPRGPARRLRGRPGVRPHGHRGDDGRTRRRPARERLPRRRHLPERDRRLREAEHLRRGGRLGPGPLHPVRQLQLRLPPQRDPLQAVRLRRAAPGRRTGSPRCRSRRAGCPTAASP